MKSLSQLINQRGELYALTMWFLIVLIYAITAMVLLRTIVIPNIYPSSIDGLIPGDSTFYDSLALEKASEIKLKGFVAFELYPSGQGVAGLASLLYIFFKSSYIVVFVNGLLHALSAVIMALIARHWFPLSVSIIATMPLAVSPYMILWFSQLNKESNSLLGFLLIVFGMLELVSKGKTLLNFITNAFFIVCGMLLIWTVRPYINLVLMPILTFIFLITLVTYLRNKSTISDSLRFITTAVIILFCLVTLSTGGSSSITIDRFTHEFTSETFSDTQLTTTPSAAESETNTQPATTPSIARKCLAKLDSKYWINDPLLPIYINAILKSMMGQRCQTFGLLESQTNPTTLSSIIDTDVLPGGSRETLRYFPRAALYGIFSPWPNKFFYTLNQRSSFFYTVTSIEAIIMYLGIIGMIILLVRRKVWLLTVPISLSFTLMVAAGMSNPFIGTLYRYRYPCWMIIICLGTAAWIALRQDWRFNR